MPQRAATSPFPPGDPAVSHHEVPPAGVGWATAASAVTAPPFPTQTTVPVVIGCHGGAGTTTVARLIGGVVADMHVAVVNAAMASLIFVFVAWGNPYGARCAAEAFQRAPMPLLRRAGLIVVADGPWPRPRQATMRYRILSGQVAHVAYLPYVARWRYVDDPLGEKIPAPVTHVVDRVRRWVASATPQTHRRSP